MPKSQDRSAANKRAYVRKMERLGMDPEAREAFRQKRRAAQKAYRERQKGLTSNQGGPTSAPAEPSTGSIDATTLGGPSVIPIDPTLLGEPIAGPSTAVTISPLGANSNAVPAPPLVAKLDFVSGVRGIQVPESATVIEWPGGLKTIAPTVERGGANTLEYDESYVRHIASFPQAVPGSAYIDFLDPSSYEHPFHLVVDIRKSLSLGRPVVVCNFEDTSKFEFSDDGLLRSFGISPNMRIDMHDACIRAEDFSHPHVFGTMSELLAGINDPTQCRFSLDVPLAHRAMPQSISMLDDGLTVGWSQTQHDALFEKRKVSADNLLVRSWGLAHQAGVFTHPHHDSDGDATYIIGMSGLKIWTFYFLRDKTKSRDQVSLILHALISTYEIEHPEWCAESVYVYPGDLVIQPPGQVHAVYTPVASFTIGGHFYSYDGVHLTEYSRHLDRYPNENFTNQIHHHALETLAHMTIGLPRSDPRRKLKRHSLTALCLMVLYPERYKVPAHDTRATRPILHAQQIARSLLTVLGHKNFEDAHAYFSDRLFDDPGEDFDWADALEAWRVIA